MVMPETERIRFENHIRGQAEHYNLTPEEYLRKIWYHEEAARIGEYMAMTLLDQLLPLAPMDTSESGSELEEEIVT